MCECFEISIQNLLECYTKTKTYDCVRFYNDFSKNIAKPSDKQNVPLMNEIIFFPALNTLIKSVNSVDSKALGELHPELTTVISNGTYLSNERLSELYSEYIQNKNKK